MTNERENATEAGAKSTCVRCKSDAALGAVTVPMHPRELVHELRLCQRCAEDDVGQRVRQALVSMGERDDPVLAGDYIFEWEPERLAYIEALTAEELVDHLRYFCAERRVHERMNELVDALDVDRRLLGRLGELDPDGDFCIPSEGTAEPITIEQLERMDERELRTIVIDHLRTRGGCADVVLSGTAAL